jgi:gliotoxin/aspirochlorine biosynthesis gamma-glutamylcyclotransferase
MVWYFAYGSNMNPKVLSGRRKVFPTISEPALIRDWYLNFDVVGIPFLEPAFSSIGERPIFENQPCVHGVLHQVTKEDFKQIQLTEGHNYEKITLKATKYNGKQIDCVSIAWKPRAYYHDRFYSSKRYMNLLIDGATRFELERSYIEFLKSVPFYQNPGGIGHNVGKWFYISMAITAALPVVIPMALYRFYKKEIPSPLGIAFDWILFFLGMFYYFVFRPLFGNGAGERKQKIE